VLHVADLLPLQCARETQTGSACPSFWNPIAARIGADPGGVPTTRVDSGQNTASAGNQSGNDCSLAWSSSAKPNAVYWVIAIAVGLARRTRLDATLLVAIVLRGHG
jgi:hypothetical protein